MNQEELIRLENLFIRLYNQGKSVNEIANSLEIDPELVAKWQSDLEKEIANNEFKKDGINVVATSKNNDGSYRFSHSFKFRVNGRERVRMGLWQIASRDLEPEGSSLYKFNYLIKEAKQHLAIIEEYLEDVRIERLEKDNGYSYEIFPYNEDEEIVEKLSDAIKFFISIVLRSEDRIEANRLISDISTDKYYKLSNSLCFCIKQIKIENYIDIKKTHIEDIPIDSQWIFITGENGYGKTSFLQAIALGLFGVEDEGDNILEDTNSRISIEYKYNNENRINSIKVNPFQQFDYLVCYGPSRLQIQAKMSQKDESKITSTTYGIFNSDGILLNIERSLIIWYLDDLPRFNEVKGIFKKVIPYLSDIIIEKNSEGDFDVFYVECEEGNDIKIFKPVQLNKMAAGLRSIIAMIGDMIVRLIRKQPYVKTLSRLTGIVLIDELENHLHPKWQYQLPSLLSSVFPEVQFIATTHSVIPILGAPEGSTFLKVDRSKDEGVIVERLDIDVSNLLPNSILTSPIFDMNTIRPLSNQDSTKLRTEDSYNEVIDNDKIDDRLKAFEITNQNYPDSLFE